MLASLLCAPLQPVQHQWSASTCSGGCYSCRVILGVLALPACLPTCSWGASTPPLQVLLLDEITVDLDVLGRADLMEFLKQECRDRGATIIYVRAGGELGGRWVLACHACILCLLEHRRSVHAPAGADDLPPCSHPLSTCSSPLLQQATHIFDGLEAWPSHLMYVAGGELRVFEQADNVPELQQGELLRLVERWLREEQRQRLEQQAQHKEQGGSGADTDIHLATWNNGYSAGRLTSSLKLSSNAVMRM